MKKIIATGLTVLMLSACGPQGPGYDANNNMLNKQNVGTVLGGVGGAVLGSKIGKGSGNVAAIAAGTLLGAAVGNGVGASLDRQDMTYYNQSSQSALETARSGQVVTWTNPDSGHSGTITPTNTYQQADGSYCREYTQTVRVSGRNQQAYGRACRQPDGSWKVVE